VESLFHRRGHPELHLPADEGSIESPGRNPDDGVGHVVEALHLADDFRIRVVAIAPQPIADDHHRMRIAAHIFSPLEAAPDNGTNADGLEIVRRNDHPARGFRMISDAQRGAGNRADESILAQRAIPAQILKIGPGELGGSAFTPGGSGQGEQPLLMRDHGVGAEQNSFDPAEHRGIGPNAQGQTQNCQEGEAGAPNQLPQPVTNVLSKVLPKAAPASVPAALFERRDSAHGARGGSAPLLETHPFGQVLLDWLFEMRASLLFHPLIHLMGTKEGAHAQRQGIEPWFDFHFRPL
jgi:hypothetical protein